MRTITRVSAVVAAVLTLGALPAKAQSANINGHRHCVPGHYCDWGRARWPLATCFPV